MFSAWDWAKHFGTFHHNNREVRRHADNNYRSRQYIRLGWGESPLKLNDQWRR